MILTDTKERTRFFKFALVGTLGAVIDFGVMNLLSHFTNMPLVYAGTISFTCAVVSNFIWNRYWTYPESRSRPLPKQLGMFFLVNLAGIAIRIPILHYLEPPLLRFFEECSQYALRNRGVLRQKSHPRCRRWNCHVVELFCKQILDL